MKKVPVSKGYYALVDDDDYERVITLPWHIIEARPGYFYASSSKNLLMHRFISGAVKGEVVDHKDGDGLNNQKDNLQNCTQSNNVRRGVKRKTSCSSKFKGVYKHPGRPKWRAQINPNRKTVDLGWYDDEVSAAKAYNKAALEYFGEFAGLNKI